MLFKFIAFFAVFSLSARINVSLSQETKPMLLSEAIVIGINNYQSILAKRNFLNASTSLVQDAKNEYLPNVIASIQHDYGTINAQFGPLSTYGAQGLASSGPVRSSQTWDAAFGAMYLINTNWEFFTFGRIKSRISLANAAVRKDSADLQQEEFVQSVKIAGAYLNLLAAKKFIQNAEANLQRTLAIQQAVLARTKSGLNPGVDSSIANAEVSKGKLNLLESINNGQEASNLLAQLINVTPVFFLLDTSFFNRIPTELSTANPIEQNPQVRFYQARIDESNVASAFLRKSTLPGVNLFSVFQTRGSGFGFDYNPATNFKYSTSYWDGIKPSRNNYVVGFSLAWNIINPLKVRQEVLAQNFITNAYKNEYDQVTTQLKDQLLLAGERINNNLQIVREVPLQYQAAAEAYRQKSVLFKNGLTNIVDLQQALFALNQAETDQSIAYINVWQALLLKAAASGDFELFRKQVQ